LEVKIGVLHTGRELVLESAETPAAVEKTVTAALAGGTGVLQLVDEKGRRVIVPVDKLAYVEIADVHRTVGFTPS
jgi:hypothetical protein